MKYLAKGNLGMIIVLIGIFLGPMAFAYADQAQDTNASASQTYTWQDKLKRGAINMGTFPVEVAREIQITSNEKNLLNGWTVGLAKGVGQGLLRLGAGLVDVLTCPFNFPDDQKKPLIEPEYVWEKPGVKYS